MKKQTSKTVIVSTLTLILSFALSAKASPAGGVDGGGGRGVVCYNEQNQIVSAELLDFYEATRMYKLQIPKSDEPMMRQLERAISRYGEKSPLLSSIYTAQSVFQKFNFLPEDTDLAPIDDSKEIVVPRNCHIEQLANFVNPELILINTRIWNQLSQTDRAGLVLHETIYWQERILGNSDSRRSRRITSLLFSPETQFEAVNAGVPKDALECMGFDNSGKEPKQVSHFFAYQNQDSTWTLQFIVLGSNNVVSKKTMTLYEPIFQFSKKEEIGPGDEDVGESSSTGGRVDSQFESAEIIHITRRVEALTDYRTGQPIPGYHRVRYYLAGLVGEFPQKDLNPAIINCSVETIYPRP